MTSPSRPHRRAPWLVPALVGALVVGAGGAGWSLWDGLGVGRCEFRAAGRTESFEAEQAGNAAVITGVSVKRGMPARAATIALATAIQESKLKNITYGDRDSLGLFQQRPSQGWGTPEEILDPVHSSGAFYDALEKVNGWQEGEVTVVAQAVQRSGFPEAYADHEWEGRVLASVLTGAESDGVGCRLPETDAGEGTVAGVIEALSVETGTTGTPAPGGARQVSVDASSEQQARALGAWAVARASGLGITRVVTGGEEWTRSTRRSALHWHPADEPAGSTQVIISLD